MLFACQASDGLTDQLRKSSSAASHSLRVYFRSQASRSRAVPTLLTFPNRDRLGKKEGTRELVMSPLPYILVYTVRDASYVVRALHGAQQ